MIRLAIALVLLTGLDGQEIAVNPDKVVSLRTPRGGVHRDVHCILHTLDGKFISVTETCKTAARKLGR